MFSFTFLPFCYGKVSSSTFLQFSYGKVSSFTFLQFSYKGNHNLLHTPFSSFQKKKHRKREWNKYCNNNMNLHLNIQFVTLVQPTHTSFHSNYQMSFDCCFSHFSKLQGFNESGDSRVFKRTVMYTSLSNNNQFMLPF